MKNIVGFQVWDGIIVLFKCKILNLPIGKKDNIKIPILFLNDDSLALEVLTGILETDGCIYRNNKGKLVIEFSTTSKYLAEQIQQILNVHKIFLLDRQL